MTLAAFTGMSAVKSLVALAAFTGMTVMGLFVALAAFSTIGKSTDKTDSFWSTVLERMTLSWSAGVTSAAKSVSWHWYFRQKVVVPSQATAGVTHTFLPQKVLPDLFLQTFSSSI